MKEIEIKSVLQVYDAVDELSEDIQKLMKQAVKIRDKAYAPYSSFLVGTALLLENGEVILGNNQENACYPSGLCAERTAIYYAGANYPEVSITVMVISAKSLKYELNTPTPPCGACRQAIAEYEVKQNKPIAIYFMGETGKIIKSSSLSNILPLLFDNSYL
ncbi:cytidine deaminase [Aquimarina longa]|uniref:cytidine deaminase n=1 Tax=Aquimarina longa TaxID=1080221 RepID=UPI0007809B7A|nr:cytidine deaminase [Aquimarina longa]